MLSLYLLQPWPSHLAATINLPPSQIKLSSTHFNLPSAKYNFPSAKINLPSVKTKLPLAKTNLPSAHSNHPSPNSNHSTDYNAGCESTNQFKFAATTRLSGATLAVLRLDETSLLSCTLTTLLCTKTVLTIEVAPGLVAAPEDPVLPF